MSKKVLILTAILLVFSACELQAAVTHSTWVGGEQGEWGRASNWEPARVPDNTPTDTFAVIIDGGSSAVLVWFSHQNRRIDSLTTYGEVNIDASDLYLIIKGDLTNTAGANITLDHIKPGNLYNETGSMVQVNGGVGADRDLGNAGIIRVVTTGVLWGRQTLHNTGRIIVSGGTCGSYNGIVDNDTTGVITGFGIVVVGELLRNKGEIYAFGGSLSIDILEGPLSNSGVLGNYPLSSLHIKSAADVNNFGTIEVNAGGGIAFDCNVVNEPNAAIELKGGALAAHTITQKADAVFDGQGDITADLIMETNGLMRITGPTNIFGNVEIHPNATLKISDGTTLITGQTTCNGTIHMKGGRIIPQGGLSGDCNIIWEPGTYTNVADFNLDGQVNFKDLAYFADTWLWQTSWH